MSVPSSILDSYEMPPVLTPILLLLWFVGGWSTVNTDEEQRRSGGQDRSSDVVDVEPSISILTGDSLTRAGCFRRARLRARGRGGRWGVERAFEVCRRRSAHDRSSATRHASV